MKRITTKDLEHQAYILNSIMDTPVKASFWNEGTVWNIGSVYIAGAYGGYKLLRVTNKGGGCEDVLPTGYTTKRDLYKNMRCFERGLHLMQEKMEV